VKRSRRVLDVADASVGKVGVGVGVGRGRGRGAGDRPCLSFSKAFA
jgi:hypothetical protein